MDDRLHIELSSWLEFYRELGIEEFYRSTPGSAAPLPTTREGTPVSADGRQPLLQAASKPGPEETVPVISAAPPVPPLRAEVSQTAVGAPPIRPPAPTLSLFEAPPTKPSGPETLEEIRADLGDCHRCKLASGRKHIVFGEGNPHAELVFVGEGPGADEDEQGLPFVGRAGQLLNRMIQMIGMKRG